MTDAAYRAGGVVWDGRRKGSFEYEQRKKQKSDAAAAEEQRLEQERQYAKEDAERRQAEYMQHCADVRFFDEWSQGRDPGEEFGKEAWDNANKYWNEILEETRKAEAEGEAREENEKQRRKELEDQSQEQQRQARQEHTRKAAQAAEAKYQRAEQAAQFVWVQEGQCIDNLDEQERRMKIASALNTYYKANPDQVRGPRGGNPKPKTDNTSKAASSTTQAKAAISATNTFKFKEMDYGDDTGTKKYPPHSDSD